MSPDSFWRSRELAALAQTQSAAQGWVSLSRDNRACRPESVIDRAAVFIGR